MMFKLLSVTILFAVALWCQALLPIVSGVPVLSSGGGQAPVNGATCNSGGLTCTITLAVTAGNILVAGVVSTTPAANTLSVTDTQNTYSSIHAAFADSGPATITQLFCASVTATNGALVVTFHVTNSANFMSGYLEQYSSASCTVDKADAGNTFI